MRSDSASGALRRERLAQEELAMATRQIFSRGVDGVALALIESGRLKAVGIEQGDCHATPPPLGLRRRQQMRAIA